MTDERRMSDMSSLPTDAARIARQALAESRLRGLPAAEEYRVIADRLYRGGYRDLPAGALLAWIEHAVAADYERLLRLRAFGDELHAALAAGDTARVALRLAAELDGATRAWLIDELCRLNDVVDEHP